MIKRNLNKTSYIFNGYIVTMQRTHNTKDGAPMYSADITKQNQNSLNSWGYLITASYTFKGHFDSEPNEAKFILDEHIKRNI